MMQDDPFADVSFEQQEPVVSLNADDLTTVLKSFGPQPTAFSTVASGADTAGGVKRVNTNTAETGVVGFRDAKGQASFTNVAKNPLTSKEEKLLPGSGQEPTGIQKIEAPVVLTSILTNLSKVTDAGAARGLFSSFQEAAAKEQIRIQSEALAHAQTKLGVPRLEAALAQAEMADKFDPMWYPGIGDSPITMKMRTELDQARGYADTEAKRLLGNNLSFKILSNQVVNAQAEMTRIQRGLDRKEAIDDNKTLRADAKKEAKDEADKEAAEGITSVQLARIQLLNAAEFVDDDALANPRVRAMKIIKNNKNPDFVKAVTAEGPELSVLAVKGNQFAKKIVVTEEATNTGMSVTDIEAQFARVQEIMASPKKLGKQAEAAFASLQTQLTLDPSRKAEIGDSRIRLAMKYVQAEKTSKFINDVSSWGSVDPALNAARATAQKTTGKQTMEETLVAYLADSVGPEYIQKLSEFNKLGQAAARKHDKSLFGMPDYREAQKLIVQYQVEKGTIKRWLEKTGAIKLTLPDLADNPALAAGGFGLPGAALDFAGKSIQNYGKPPAPVIDPATGLPFGE